MNHVERADNFMRDLGVEAYRVGGSVRDELLGREPKDADYLVRGVGLVGLGSDLRGALRAWPKPSLKPITLRDGRTCGWRVAARGLRSIEIMLPRVEVARTLTPEEKLQGGGVRRAFDIVVDPGAPLDEDAKRRDFTFNALYKRIVPDSADMSALTHDILEGIFDPTECGLYDLQHRLVRTTHETSFRDDPLRTLRALRFVAVLDYDLATCTVEQMERYAEAVTGLSHKGHTSGTVLDELTRILMSDRPAKALRLARDTGVLENLLPELAPMLGFEQGSRYHDLTTDEHTFVALETAAHVGAPLRVRLALLFHDAGKPTTAWHGADERLHYYAQDGSKRLAGGATEDHEVASERLWLQAADRLAVDRKLTQDVALLIREHMVTVEGKLKGTKVRRMRVRFGDAMLHDLLLHRACDASGKGTGGNKAHLERVALMEHIRAEAEKAGVPASTKDLAVNGHDLLELGLEGRQIGGCLDVILDEVVCQPTDLKRSREWQLEQARAYAAHAEKIRNAVERVHGPG
jgi:tRNA nucleotidyltransferase (CCA-adding enzyme)